ncbi:TPA: LysR family transcriptional regulator [Photobacterium damselae]|uniref:LysR family transcriptional regulator n=3 Tax=Photobacterium damselae TaxID=38293 RepID=A0ACD3SUI5_PHODM|nr:LysR family transcriptional regulator [Photobacterium damselae]EEZ40738.1 putative transcriptional regulator LysR family [Photobacterium damselae subsp. damselae CIP 102761]ELV7516248.1 LysR family transcriptional regulator [Photobacterium damselae]KAB1179712.1 LysR family transcriptional regulator [Photobacterium damselae subsp. damselae]KAB1519370.1 LysR family transcriptional regulator [Photobacterium damselae subsp. damselae]MBF7098216.1 LysR family transcriptional regulator [Photobacte
MDTRLLTYFHALAEAGNFTKAAEKLHIAQPALSVAIKKLEQQLELDLFHRNERKITLTHEGEVLLQHAKIILQQLKDANIAMAELRGLEKGEVRLGVPSMLGSYFFPQILMGFKSRYPNLKLTMVEAGTQSIRKMLVDGELDLGVIINENVPDSLNVEHLLTSQMVAVVSPEHPFAQQNQVNFDDFFQQEMVMFKTGYFHREFIDRVCSDYQLEPKISFETNLLPMILNIVRHDFAVSALLELVTEHESGVTAVPFATPVYLDIAMAWRKTGYLSLAERTFMDFVKQHCQK